MNAAIVGVGATTFSSESGRSELALAVDAIGAALADAGLDAADVDGMVRYTYDSNGFPALIRALGVRGLRFFSEVPLGGSATCGTIAHAAAAVDAGLASHVVCFRALNGRSGVRLGRAERHLRGGADEVVCAGEQMPGGVYSAPYGLLVPAQVMALWAQRYAWQHGIPLDRLARGLGTVAVTQRGYAQANPRATTYGDPLTLEDYLAGRMIASPLRVFDLCRETDGAVAIVVSRADESRGGVRVLAAAQQLFPYTEALPAYAPDVTATIPPWSTDDFFARAGITRDDVDVLGVYDATTLSVLFALEDFGFCGRGEAIDFVCDGGTTLAGRLPTNTSGGLLSEAHVHGLNIVMEAVQQLRGASTSQVAGAEVALVHSRSASLVLGR